MTNKNEFFQSAAELKNQYEDDVILKRILEKNLPTDMRKLIEPHLKGVGHDAANLLLTLSTEAELESNKPALIQFNPFGKRIDHIKMCPEWDELVSYAGTNGLIASGYERKNAALEKSKRAEVVAKRWISKIKTICVL